MQADLLVHACQALPQDPLQGWRILGDAPMQLPQRYLVNP